MPSWEGEDKFFEIRGSAWREWRKGGDKFSRHRMARRAADRRLADVDDLVDVLEVLDPVVRGGGARGGRWR